LKRRGPKEGPQTANRGGRLSRRAIKCSGGEDGAEPFRLDHHLERPIKVSLRADRSKRKKKHARKYPGGGRVKVNFVMLWGKKMPHYKLGGSGMSKVKGNTQLLGKRVEWGRLAKTKTRGRKKRGHSQVRSCPGENQGNKAFAGSIALGKRGIKGETECNL